MTVSLVKRLSLLACILTLPLSFMGYGLIWSAGWPPLFLCYLLFMPLIILSLLIVGGVCRRPRLTLALCCVGMGLFLCYAAIALACCYALNTGLISPLVWD